MVAALDDGVSLKEKWIEWMVKVKELGKVESSHPAVAKLLKAMDEIDHTADNANGKSLTNMFRVTSRLLHVFTRSIVACIHKYNPDLMDAITINLLLKLLYTRGPKHGCFVKYIEVRFIIH